MGTPILYKKAKGRYDISGLTEAQFEPGSRGRVLKNLLGIKLKRQMDKAEYLDLLCAEKELINIYDKDHCFTSSDILKIHKVWLGKIYAWAGQHRSVNTSKDGFLFATANQIPKLMADLEKGLLRKFTPCNFDSTSEVVRAIAEVHTELVLIHPFREGNGRLARLLAIMMAMQGGLPPLDFGGIQGKKRQEYFSAIHAGMDRNYRPMERIFTSVVRRTVRLYEKKP